jgi:hypothetical protein
MNNYCIYIRKRKNKPYCTILKKEITLPQCQECVNKKYKNAQKNKNIVQNTPAKHSKKSIKVHKSKKIAKLERNRKSVFTNDLEHCYLCGKKKEELHEIFAGRNRLNSMKYDLVLPLCHKCHSLNQNNPFFNDYWHKQGQEYFECNIGTREEFIKIFKRNYL